MRLVRSRSIAAKRQTPQLASSFQKREGRPQRSQPSKAAWFQIVSRFAQPLAKRPNDKRLSVILDSTKKEGCQRGEDSPMRWFVYSRSLWMMKRPS